MLLGLYLSLRLGDLFLADRAVGVSLGDPLLWVFMLEIGVTAAAALLLLIPRFRNSKAGLTAGSALAILGVLGYRFNVTIVAFYRPADMPYFPSLSEFMVSLGLVAAAVLLFLFFVENLNVLPAEETGEGPAAPPDGNVAGATPFSTRPLIPSWLGPLRNYSLAVAVGAALALALIADDIRTESMSVQTPVSPPLQIAHASTLPVASPLEALLFPLRRRSSSPSWMIFDGNRDGRVVVFDHDAHARKLGGESACPDCHHAELPFRLETPCSGCHRDLYLPTDLFQHAHHVARLGGNGSCSRCHLDKEAIKTRLSAAACGDCHRSQWRTTRLVSFDRDGHPGMAPPYRDALHGLCRGCHLREAGLNGAPKDLGECRTCHHRVAADYMASLGPYAREGVQD